VSLTTRDAQMDALTTRGIPDKQQAEPACRYHPARLVANGDQDGLVPTENTYLLAEHRPNAQLRIYLDAGHGFLFQHPAEFASEVNRFLA
jgi:pimeloyl-ACP methyl ester carboxylesterase